MLTIEDVTMLIRLTIEDMPPGLKEAYYEAARMDGTELIHRRLKVSITQKTICIIKHNEKTLPILDYIDSRSFIALSLSGGVILWIYKGMAMLIPAAKIINMANLMESMDKQDLSRTKLPQFFQQFTTNDAILLPKIIAAALLDD